MNKGRVVLISGAGTGIGAALARRFADEGDKVMGLGRSFHRLQVVGRSISKNGGVFIPIRSDIRSENSVRRALQRSLSRFGRIDILVNNAGVTYFKDFLKTSRKEFDEVMETNLRGMFLVTRGILASMIRKRKGLIVNVLSYAAKTIYTGSSIYSASKSAGEAMMNVLREETRHKGIKVLNVYPGATETPMWKAGHRKRHGRKMMHARDIADLVVEATFLPSSAMTEEIVVRPQHGDLRI